MRATKDISFNNHLVSPYFLKINYHIIKSISKEVNLAFFASCGEQYLGKDPFRVTSQAPLVLGVVVDYPSWW